MNDQTTELIEQYIRAASGHFEATERGDSKTANKCHDKLMTILKKMLFALDGRPRLLKLIYHSNDAVVCWAATHSLSYNESESLAALRKLSKGVGSIAFDSKMVIELWLKGELHTL